MADLSSERISFEAALAALLDLYGIEGGADPGTILPTRLSLINGVKVKLDELIPEGEGVVFDLEETPNVSDPYDLLINAILNEAAKRVLMNCPKHYLSPVKSNATATPDATDTKIGYIVLPDNFLRFISLKMAEWKRPVTDLTPVGTEEYFMQYNPYVRGGIAKPKAASTHRSIGESSQTTTTTITSNYGALYNWHSVNNANNIAASNAHVPTSTEFAALITALGGATIATTKLKEAGLLHWNSPNSGTNESGLSFVGGGGRSGATAQYFDLKNSCYFWTSTSVDTDNATMFRILGNDPISNINTLKIGGLSVRLIVDTPIEINGSNAIYVGNDLKRYNCKLMSDGKWWITSNLAETKYRTGDEIPVTPLSLDSFWKTDTSGVMCYYDDDINNGLTTTTTTTTTNTSTQARVIEYFSVNYSHTIDWLLYIQETEAENVQVNLRDALTWMSAGMVLQIIERGDLAKLAFEQEAACYINL